MHDTLSISRRGHHLCLAWHRYWPAQHALPRCHYRAYASTPARMACAAGQGPYCYALVRAHARRTCPDALSARRCRSLAIRPLLPPDPLCYVHLGCDTRVLGSSGPECCLLHHIRLCHCPTSHLLACLARPNQCRHSPEHAHVHRLHGLHCSH